MHVGKTVLQARKARGYSLQDLAERSGVSRSMLSKIERGEKNPTVPVACQIAAGLNMTLSQLLGEEKEADVLVIPREKRLVYRDESTGVERQMLSPLFPRQQIEFSYNVLPAGQATDRFPACEDGTKVCLVVVSGRMLANVGTRQVSLSEGDSLCFAASVPHQLVNPHPAACEYYLVVNWHSGKTALTFGGEK